MSRLVFVPALLLFSWACASDGATAASTASTSSSSSSSTGGAGGATGSCASICGVAAKCVGASAASCAADCASLRVAACGNKLDAIEACFATNVTELSACGHSHACEKEIAAYQSCVSMNQPGDTASASGTGGASGICDQPGCVTTPNGICSCSRDCAGASDGFSCILVPGGSICSCVIAGVPPFGDCFEGVNVCSDSEFAQNCCEQH